MAAQLNASLAAQPQQGQQPQPPPSPIPLVLWWLNLPGSEPPTFPDGILEEAPDPAQIGLAQMATPGFWPIQALAGWTRLSRGPPPVVPPPSRGHLWTI